jgi:uncharacterized protein with HEPN domain
MKPRTLKLLEDIRQAAEFIRDSAQGKSLDDYREDRMLRHAVERCFEIIGEAINRLSRDDPVTAGRITDYRAIIAFRNVLIHGYDLVDHDVVWNAISQEIPALLGEVLTLTAAEE